MHPVFAERGFLPAQDPARSFAPGSELSVLDEIGRDLPNLLENSTFRDYVRGLRIPEWPEDRVREETLSELRLYYVRLGFLASAYINQVSQPRGDTLPAQPRRAAVQSLRAARAAADPQLRRLRARTTGSGSTRAGPIALGNIDTFQNFVHLYDEHWFILVHVEIEAIGGGHPGGNRSRGARDATRAIRRRCVSPLRDIASAVWRQVAVLRRIPEKMDPALYYRTFRPYIRFFENVVYEGVARRR